MTTARGRRSEARAVPCPCGLPVPYPECCGPLHRGAAAPTAERLMRSRYSAFSLSDAGYLLASWHSTTRPEHVECDPDQRWTGLQVVRTTGGGFLDTEGTVEFRASSTSGGRRGVVHEVSRFTRDGGRWAYLGPVPPVAGGGGTGSARSRRGEEEGGGRR